MLYSILATEIDRIELEEIKFGFLNEGWFLIFWSKIGESFSVNLGVVDVHLATSFLRDVENLILQHGEPST
jgi:hypothetical protein